MISAKEALEKTKENNLKKFDYVVRMAVDKGLHRSEGVYVRFSDVDETIKEIGKYGYSVVKGHESAYGMLLHLEW